MVRRHRPMLATDRVVPCSPRRARPWPRPRSSRATERVTAGARVRRGRLPPRDARARPTATSGRRRSRRRCSTSRRRRGGLTPVRRVGGQQTKGLALVGKDGRSYTFRGVEKDPSNILPEELHDTFVEGLLRDQMAAQHPAGALIADELARAAGVPTRPGPDRGDARRPGARRVPRRTSRACRAPSRSTPPRPTAEHPGFEGAAEIIDHMTLYAKLAESPDDRVAIREYLRARLFDVFISDFDRHRKQWRWMRRPGDPLWHPIPEDRDQAFARYEGLIVRAAAGFVPQIRDLRRRSTTRSSGLTYNGREQDRWLLPELAREAWHEEAEALQAALTDEVLERAARRMPPEWYAIDGARLVAALKKRRARRCVKEADVFYQHLVEAGGRAGDRRQRARARASAQADGSVAVEVARLGADGAPETPYFQRRFLRARRTTCASTCAAGDDRVEVEGRRAADHGPRRSAAKGNDVLDDAKGGGTRFYDSLGRQPRRARGRHAWDRRPYSAAARARGRAVDPAARLGARLVLRALGELRLGLRRLPRRRLLDGRLRLPQAPWADQQTLRAGWAFGAQAAEASTTGASSTARTPASALGLPAYYSGLEVLRYYGFGNETSRRAGRRLLQGPPAAGGLRPEPHVPLAGSLDLTLAPALQYAQTEDDDDLVDAGEALRLRQLRPGGRLGAAAARHAPGAEPRGRREGLAAVAASARPATR